MRVLRVLDHTSYGWVEWVLHAPAADAHAGNGSMSVQASCCVQYTCCGVLTVIARTSLLTANFRY